MRATRVEISPAALRHNLARARAAAPGCRVVAAIKADGYGHGLITVARALSDADAFGVACLAEGLALRAAGFSKPVVVLEGVFGPEELSEAADAGFELVIHHPQQLAWLSESTRGPLAVWIKVDSGMHRLGFAPGSVGAVREHLSALSGVRVLGFMTHLAEADDRSSEATARQLKRFEEATAGLPGERSIANSAAVLGCPVAHADCIRPGVMLYGVAPFLGERGPDLGLRPAMTFHSELIAVNRVPAGEGVGYGGSWVTPEEMPVGVVAVGYGDGYPRHAPSGTPVLLNGRRVPLVGRVSMDMITVDLRSQPDARVGDAVVLWGDGLPVEEVAEHSGTIGYELLCRVAPRVRRCEGE